MNLSAIEVPEYLQLVRLSLIAIVSVTAVTLIAGFALQPAIQGFKDQQDRNFAAALQRTYGATSSVPYSEFAGLGGDRVSVLTRDGQSTNIRFDVKDGVITPITLSEALYPKADGTKP